MSLDRNLILGFVDKNVGEVEVPELGGTVHVASFTAAESDRIGSWKREDGVPFYVELVIAGISDAKGERLFKREDAERLGKLPAKAINAMAEAVLKHNALNKDAQDELKND